MAVIRKNNEGANGVLKVDASGSMLHKNMTFAASEQYKLLRANLYFTLQGDSKCSVVGVTSSVRG